MTGFVVEDFKGKFLFLLLGFLQIKTLLILFHAMQSRIGFFRHNYSVEVNFILLKMEWEEYEIVQKRKHLITPQKSTS